MELKVISEDKLNDLKSNLPHLVEKFKNQDNSWLQEYFKEEPFIKTKYTEVNDFTLDMSQEKAYLTDFENVKLVYENLRFLTNSQASEERLWSALCLGPFWNYVQYRWQPTTKESIEQHFFFGFGARRSLTRNAIARLWWIGRLTYDKQREDPYELTKFVCESSDNIMHILERNTSNNIDIIRAFLSAILDYKKEGFSINTNDIGEVSKYLNLLGGTYILDNMPYELIYNKIYSHLKKYQLAEK